MLLYALQTAEKGKQFADSRFRQLLAPYYAHLAGYAASRCSDRTLQSFQTVMSRNRGRNGVLSLHGRRRDYYFKRQVDLFTASAAGKAVVELLECQVSVAARQLKIFGYVG